MLGFVAHDQTNISADSLGVAIDKPFREVLGPVRLYICVVDRLHFDLRGRRWLLTQSHKEPSRVLTPQ